MARRTGFIISMVTAILPVVALVLLLGLSEYRLRDHPEVPPFTSTVRVDLTTIERGEHLARTRGCLGCHGQRLEGRDFSKQWTGIGRVVAPNLARYAREHTPETIERALRHGIGSSGRALWSMPSYNFRHLTDEDVAALIAFLRAQPVLGDSLPGVRTTLEVRWLVAVHGYEDIADLVALVPEFVTQAGTDSADVIRGEYTAMTTCTECHGFDVRGQRWDGNVTPDLAVVAGYSIDEFRRLMRDGVSRTGNDTLRLMSEMARSRFSNFTAAEVADLYAFLRTLPARPVATPVIWRETP